MLRRPGTKGIMTTSTVAMTSSMQNQRGFASPFETLDRSFLDAIVRQRSSRFAELFLKCFKKRLTARTEGLDVILERLRDEPDNEIGFETWASLGQLRFALLSRNDEHHAIVAAVNLALHLAERGRSISFEATFGRVESFRFGNYIIPRGGRLSWKSDGQTAQLKVDEKDLFFSRTRGEWKGKVQELVRLTPGPDGTKLSRPVLLLPMLPNSDAMPNGLSSPGRPHEEIRSSYEAAFRLIADHAAIFKPWVERTVHAIVPVDAPYGSTTSSSFEHHPTIIALSHDSPALSIADALVHEASHQHVYLLTQLGPVDDGTDTRLYFSPARRTERPIDKILLAYHAFANVLLFYRACQASGLGDDELCQRQERAYAESVAELQRPLEATHALTPLGRALFEPLAARLNPDVGGSAHVIPREEAG